MSRKASLGTVGDVNNYVIIYMRLAGQLLLHSPLKRMIRVPDRFVIIARQYYWTDHPELNCK